MRRQGRRDSIEVAVAVRFKDQILRLEVLFAGRHADVDHVVHDHQPREMRAGSKRERAVFPGRQLGQVGADLQIVRGCRLLVVDDGREDCKSVDAAVLVGHGCLR